jgi:hypothetical protein
MPVLVNLGTALTAPGAAPGMGLGTGVGSGMLMLVDLGMMGRAGTAPGVAEMLSLGDRWTRRQVTTRS